MSDCPEDCGWTYDPLGSAAAVYESGQSYLPLVWNGAGALRRARPTDAINRAEVRRVATAAHLVRVHGWPALAA